MGQEFEQIKEALRLLGIENADRIKEIDALDTALDALFDQLPPTPPASPRNPIGFKNHHVTI
jgi:hypothetical protein